MERSVIASNNRRVIHSTLTSDGWNYRNRAKCTLGNKYLLAKIVYKAAASAPNKPDKRYFGIADTAFNQRFTQDFSASKKFVKSIELWTNTCGSWKIKNNT